MTKRDDQYLVMKCLFCGKDLPLLKRLAGAEFCSDEHRHQYQQEYSELALSRLMQNKSAGNKAGVPVKPEQHAEAASPSHPAKASAPPSVKLTESKADTWKAGPRPVAEPRIVPTAAAPTKPSPITRSSRPLLNPLSATLASPASERAPKPEPKKPPITPPSARPVRSVVPLQETKPLKVTETRGTDAKLTETETARTLPVQELPRPSRPSSAHTTLRLELPVGPSPSARLAPERQVVPVPEPHSEEPPAVEALSAPVADHVASAPVAEVTSNDAAVKETANDTEPIESAPNKDEPQVSPPAAIAGLVVSQPPHADWKTGARVTELQMAPVLLPVLPRGGLRARAANLNSAGHLSSTEILNPSAPLLAVRLVRLEIRDFARMEPVLDFKPSVDTPYVPAADRAMVLSFAAAPLQTEPKLWAEPAREFGAWLEPPERDAFLESLAAGCEVLKESAAADLKPRPNGKASTHAIDLSREPRPVTSAKTTAPEGIPGGKAKPVQMFTATLRESVQAAIPQYDALPLRATMLVGQADGSASSSLGGTKDADRAETSAPGRDVAQRGPVE